MFSIGDLVVVLAPFNIAFPDTYTIDYIHEDGTCVIAGDRDFDPIYLERVN